MVKINMLGDNEKYTFSQLLEVVQILRSPGGCPWDIEQTHQSIRNDLLEEAYETADSIDRDDMVDMCEELGDVLFQVVFHCQIAKENAAFNIDDVIDGICRKMILRHPHVFGNAVANTSDAVLENWDVVKQQEKHQTTYTQTLKAVPNAFPALMRAAKVQKRAAKAGMCLEELSENLENINALCKTISASSQDSRIYEDYGKLLFNVVALSRNLGINAEQALQQATNDYIDHFEQTENACNEKGISITDVSAEDTDKLFK